MNTKKRILGLLEQCRGESISGTQIAETLNISRNAVWKAVKELRKDGYEITAITNKGYCLSVQNDIVSPEGVRPFLTESVRPCADKLHVFQTLESTNKTAKEMAVAGAEHGTVIISDCQTAGRGRFSRDFFSPAGGGLYMSIILHPEALHLHTVSAVTALAAVVVCEAIEAVSTNKPMIKWVNDIYVEDKKVCGILTEGVTDFESGTLGWIVLGIGINLNIRTEDFPPDLQTAAISVYPKEKVFGVRNRISAEILNRILDPEAFPKEEIFKKYKKRLMMLGETITVIQGNTVYEGTAVDIDGAGRLIVKKENGEMDVLSSGEISIRRHIDCQP